VKRTIKVGYYKNIIPYHEAKGNSAWHFSIVETHDVQPDSVANPKRRKRGAKTIYQLRPHLSQMHTTKYMPFTPKKAALQI